jgi:bifunctional DNA-binding transcriptional regulator/antitoxin component of YhaV-PrlF toxin-antitoxin module
MRATSDDAGRMFIPRPLRELLGLTPGVVEVAAEGNNLRVEAIAGAEISEGSDHLFTGATGVPIDDVLLRALRDADQR